MHDDVTKSRCSWVGNNPLMIEYHDREWGVPVHEMFAVIVCGFEHEKRATTHWAFASDLQKKYPDVKVDANPIWIQDGNIYTSAESRPALISLWRW